MDLSRATTSRDQDESLSLSFSALAWRLLVVSVIALGALGWLARDLVKRLSVNEALIVAGVALALAVLVTTAFVLGYIVPTISRPALALSSITEQVASGNLTVTVSARAQGGLARLTRATGSMIHELRTLVGALRSSSAETAALATEITAGSQHMAAAASEMATTSSELSQQSTEMAQAIQEMAGDASQLVAIAGELSEGVHEGMERNTRLRGLARENRTRLDESSRALETLAAEVQTSATAVDALAAASEEIRAFVTLVQKMARQSKLLALNAAMEAARAGEHGMGFAVVATEVRRLAASSSDAAERTEATVHGVLQRVEESKASSARSVDTVQEVLAATREGQRSFAQVEDAVTDTEAWTTAVEQAAGSSRTLVTDMTVRLDSMARATESFAAAMQQVAASSQEQSASTEQIAAAADALSAAAVRLASAVASFNLGDAAASSSGEAPAGNHHAQGASRPRRTTLQLTEGELGIQGA